MQQRNISWESWPRKPIFDFFSPMSHPFYAVTFTVDVTELVDWCRRTGCSFYCAMVYFSTKALNSVEAFRYYTAGGDLFLLDRRIPSFTDLHPGYELFHIVTLDCGDDPVDFCRRAKAKSAAQTTFLDQASETADLIYFPGWS